MMVPFRNEKLNTPEFLFIKIIRKEDGGQPVYMFIAG